MRAASGASVASEVEVTDIVEDSPNRCASTGTDIFRDAIDPLDEPSVYPQANEVCLSIHIDPCVIRAPQVKCNTTRSRRGTRISSKD